jgi:hypothetical protein
MERERLRWTVEVGFVEVEPPDRATAVGNVLPRSGYRRHGAAA